MTWAKLSQEICMSQSRGQPSQPLALHVAGRSLARAKVSGRTASMPAFPKSCEVQLPVKAASFMLERETAHFRSLVAEAGACFLAVCWCLSVPAQPALLCLNAHAGTLVSRCCHSAR